jgi:hypothetical protein
MNGDIQKYNDSQSSENREICNQAANPRQKFALVRQISCLLRMNYLPQMETASFLRRPFCRNHWTRPAPRRRRGAKQARY